MVYRLHLSSAPASTDIDAAFCGFASAALPVDLVSTFALTEREKMAFNNVGRFTIGPGESIGVAIWWDDREGEDHGAQWIGAHPFQDNEDMGITFIVPAALLATDQTKVRQQNPHARNFNRYEATIINVGSETVMFSLQGGGFT